MRARTAARWTRAPWLYVLVALAGLVPVLLAGQFTSRYAVNAVADAEYALRLIVPLATGYCAYLGSELAPYVDRMSSRRTWFRGMSALVWPALLAPLAAYLTVVASVLVLSDALGSTAGANALSLIGTGLAMTFGWSVFGVVVGSVLPTLAAPALAIAVHLLLTWPPALATTPWPRLLTGIQYGCCTSAQQPIAASLLFALGLAAILLAVSRAAAAAPTRGARAKALASASTIAGAALVGVAMSVPVGRTFGLAEPRPDETVCRGGQPVTCLWPEDAADVDLVATWVSDAYRAWSDNPLGADPPEQLSEFTGNPGQHYLGFTPGVSRPQLAANVAYADLMTRGGGGMCAAEAPDVQAASIWLTHEAGLDASSLMVAPSVREEVDRVLALTPDSQQAWFSDVLEELSRCRR